MPTKFIGFFRLIDACQGVSEEHNPANEKGVTGAEVFVPSSLLATGLCLVDTPGIGSVSAANSAATREFLPRVDAAVLVVGADPPISGEELALVRENRGRIGAPVTDDGGGAQPHAGQDRPVG